MFRGPHAGMLWDGNNGPIAEGNLFHSCAEGQILYYFSLLVMTSWETMALCSHYTCTPYRGVAVQLLLFILCDPLLLCDLLFIYLWRYSPSHDILGAEKPEGPFENLLEFEKLFLPHWVPELTEPR